MFRKAFIHTFCSNISYLLCTLYSIIFLLYDDKMNVYTTKCSIYIHLKERTFYSPGNLHET